MRKRQRLVGGGAGLLALFVASCTAVLGIDKDYHLDGEGGGSGSTATSGSGGVGGTTTTASGGTAGTTSTTDTTTTTTTTTDTSTFVCAPGTVEDCYSGPPATVGIGPCAEGTQTCSPDGQWLPCVGEVLPANDCDDNGVDDDCNGAPDDTLPSCYCGDGDVDGGEQCDDAGDSAGCDADCTFPVCGDGTQNKKAGEACDDGNTFDDDACSATCALQQVLSVVAGAGHTCALLADGRVKCWGHNQNGELGQGDSLSRGAAAGEMGAALPFVDLGQGVKATALAAGFNHTCALLSDGKVKCWGWNAFGQLGLGDVNSRGEKPEQMGDLLPAIDLGTGVTATAITAGYAHTCALLSTLNVKCWGNNTSGNLGLEAKGHRGDQQGEMGNALPPLDLGPAQVPVAITAGANHTCALLTGGVKCWGYNSHGELGLGDVANRGDDGGEMSQSLPFVSLGATATALVAGSNHTCARLSDNTVKCWGFNATGQLGIADDQDRGDAPGEMGAALPTVNLGPGVTTATALSAGDGFSCAIRTGGSVKCWGATPFGETGGSQPVDLGAGQLASAIESGSFHTCALLSSRLKCWGYNDGGQLGLGDKVNRGVSQVQMGDALPFVTLYNSLW